MDFKNHLKNFRVLLVVLTICFSSFSGSLSYAASAEDLYFSPRKQSPEFWTLFPVEPNTVELKYDPAFKEIFENGETGIRWYEEKVKQRKALLREKGSDDSFSVPELRVTMENLNIFVSHILEDKQFDQPLSDDEREAFLLLKKDIVRQLLSKQMPYKNVMKLVMTFVAIYDFTTYQKVVLKFYEKINYTPIFAEFEGMLVPVYGLDPEQNMFAVHHSEPIDTMGIYRFMKDGVISDSNSIPFGALDDLEIYINNPEIVLYPSFNPLDINDFARMGHLPVYPLGLMDKYALNADGFLHTPWKFMAHDIFHIGDHAGYKYIHGDGILESIQSRFSFITTLMDSGADYLKKHKDARKAVELILFNIFHEKDFASALEGLEQSSLGELYDKVKRQQTEEAYHFSPEYSKILKSGVEAGSVWVKELYNFWKSNGGGILGDDEMANFYERHFIPALEQSGLE